MTETLLSQDSASMSPGQNHRRLRAPLPVRRFVLGVATGLVLAASLLAGCAGGTDNFDVINLNTITVGQHLYLRVGPDDTKFEISVGKDASGRDVVTAKRVGQ